MAAPALPEDERAHWASCAVAGPSSKMFLQMRLAPGACYDDGEGSACGMTDNWLFLEFLRRPDVARWLADNGLHLGDSEEEARHWLVVDGSSGEVRAGHWREARQAVVCQGLPG